MQTYTHTWERRIHYYDIGAISIVDEKRTTVLSLECCCCFFFQFRFSPFLPHRAPLCVYIYSRVALRHRSARDRNSFPSISIFSPASGALMKNDSDARHYSSALSSVIGSFFPRARTHEKSNLSTTDIVFRPLRSAASSGGKARAPLFPRQHRHRPNPVTTRELLAIIPPAVTTPKYSAPLPTLLRRRGQPVRRRSYIVYTAPVT